MPLFSKTPKGVVEHHDPYSYWQAPPQIADLPPEPKNLSSTIALGPVNSLPEQQFEPSLVIGLASAGAHILHAVNKRLLADSSINYKNLTYLLIGEDRDSELLGSDSVYTQLFSPALPSENYRQAYAECFLDANFRTRITNCLHNRFGAVDSDFKTYIVGSLREAASAVISDLVTMLKTDFPNTEVFTFLTFEMLDDIDLVRDGEMLAQLRELGRMTFNTFHLTHRFNRLLNASSENAPVSPGVLIDRVFLFDARNLGRRDENFVYDSVQEIAEGLFYFLSPSNRILFERYSNVRTKSSAIREDLSEYLFSSFTTKSLVFPINYVRELAERELVFRALVGDRTSLFSKAGNGENSEAFIKKFRSHEYLFRDLFTWLVERVTQSADMRVLPKINSQAAFVSFRYVLMDTTNTFLESELPGQNIVTLANAIKKIIGWLENAYRIGLQNSYQGEQLARWEELESFLIESKKSCSQLLKNINGWYEKIYGPTENPFSPLSSVENSREFISDRLMKSFENIKATVEKKLMPGKITRFNNQFSDVQGISAALVAEILPKLNQYLVWKSDLSVGNALQLKLILRSNRSFEENLAYSYEEIEQFIDETYLLARKLIDNIQLNTDIQLRGENLDFLSEIAVKSGLAYNQNSNSMNIIHAKNYNELLETVYLFHNGSQIGEKSISNVAEELFGDSYAHSQKEFVADASKYRLSILKMHSMIPYSAVDIIDNLSRDYKPRYHLLPQEANSKVLENEINEFQDIAFFDDPSRAKFMVVPQLQACMWSPILFDVFFFALSRGIIELAHDESVLGNEFWQVKKVGDFSGLPLTNDTSLLDAFKAFTLTLPIVHKEGDQFHPFSFQNRVQYLQAVYDACLDQKEVNIKDKRKKWVDALNRGKKEAQCFSTILDYVIEKNIQRSNLGIEIREPLFAFRMF